MSSNVTDWVSDKLMTVHNLEIVTRTPEDFLVVKSKDSYTFLVAVLGLKDVVELSDVEPLFTGAKTPQLVVNVPSKVLWRGAAIDHIHAACAAFGTLGDVSRAANLDHAGFYRDKDMSFFINAMKQHSNVSKVSYIYDTVFKADLKTGTNLIVAIIDAYNMSAEDVRNAKNRFGNFDIVVKSTSYGSITTQAEAAAKSMSAQALTFGALMGKLAK